MLAGYDTTANALSYIAYALATNSEAQEKMRAEVDGVYDEFVRQTISFARHNSLRAGRVELRGAE